MYGANETTAAGGALAMTGAATGSTILMAVGLILAGAALLLLFKRNGKNRP